MLIVVSAAALLVAVGRRSLASLYPSGSGRVILIVQVSFFFVRSIESATF